MTFDNHVYTLLERPLKTAKRRSINNRKINPQIFEGTMSERRRILRRGLSVDNLDSTDEDSASRPGSTKQEFCVTPSGQQSKPSTSKPTAKITQEGRQPSVARPVSGIIRQRPATVHKISSNLEKQMRENAQKFCQRVVRDKGVEGLKAEFASLKKPIDTTLAQVFMSQPSGTRNRYRDVVCLDKTRVVLKNADNDYIHANYVSSPQNDKRFICTQGPTDSTRGDFWRMVVQEKSVVVVMLCNIFERQQKKCSEYFPTAIGQTLTFENMTVTCKVQKTLELGKECIHGFVIKISGLAIVTDNNPNNAHFVDHYQWLDWPDRGVPLTDLTAVSILNAIRPCKYPIVVHCSAGIGRTGSLVMMEYVLELFLAGKPFQQTGDILAAIRNQRATSVQTVDQYLYVHRVLLEYFYRLGLLDSEQMSHIKKFIDDYNRSTIQS